MKSVRSRGHGGPRVRELFFDATSHAVTQVADCPGEVLRRGRIFLCLSPGEMNDREGEFPFLSGSEMYLLTPSLTEPLACLSRM